MARIEFFILILSVIIKDVTLLGILNDTVFSSSDSDEVNAFSDNELEINELAQVDPSGAMKLVQNDDIVRAKGKADLVKQMKSNQSLYSDAANKPKVRSSDQEKYDFDPILNLIRRRNLNIRKKNSMKAGNNNRRNNFRRQLEFSDIENSSSSSSSSLELKEWKDEWADIWHEKQQQALNQSKPGGDVVNMAYSRPWGVACGDPNQHDMPWGSCMLAIECEAEFRIYRGDYFCGRTTFVCCALQVSSYDLYQGFDVSFDRSTWEEDSYERKRDKKLSKQKQNKKKKDNKKKKQIRKKRKKKIIKTIKKILKEMRNFLNRQYRNGTRFKKKRTNQLKKFIKALKRKYVKDRSSVKTVHEFELMKVDYRLMKRLEQISKMNKQFMTNSTFRDIVVNGTISKGVARTLVKQYPDLKPYFHFSTPLRRRSIDTLESGTSEENTDSREEFAEKTYQYPLSKNVNADHEKGYEHGYETEYGLLYY